ncbi:hypothetical protein ACIBG8_04650 [Nonomuraea sp. NPDC050556]|uniref:hypothetical protein n=1 Tax=Nonomuraea sp. NPDC050556 TaxID=3364369 RepID=UPI0037A50FD9
MTELSDLASAVETKARYWAGQALQLRVAIDEESQADSPATRAANVTARYRAAHAELLAAIDQLDSDARASVTSSM